MHCEVFWLATAKEEMKGKVNKLEKCEGQVCLIFVEVLSRLFKLMKF